MILTTEERTKLIEEARQAFKTHGLEPSKSHWYREGFCCFMSAIGLGRHAREHGGLPQLDQYGDAESYRDFITKFVRPHFDREHFRYGIMDGWDGKAKAQQDWYTAPRQREYEEGYELGRDAWKAIGERPS